MHVWFWKIDIPFTRQVLSCVSGGDVESGYPVKTFSCSSLGQADKNYFWLASNTVALYTIVLEKHAAWKEYINFWKPVCFLQQKWLLCYQFHMTAGMRELQISCSTPCLIAHIIWNATKIVSSLFQNNEMLWDLLHCKFLLLNITLSETRLPFIIKRRSWRLM